MKPPLEVGQRFGKLRLIKLLTPHKNREYRKWRAICDCGKKYETHEENFLQPPSGKPARQCTSCRKRKFSVLQHITRNGRMRRSPEYASYEAAKSRCEKPSSGSYYNYGAKGIEFRFKDFGEFLSCLGLRPKGMVLDRYPNGEGHYEPGNVRWTTPTINAHRRKHYGKTSQYRGVFKTGKKWMAALTYKYKFKYLGVFVEEIEAARAYDKETLKIYGSEAILNFPFTSA